jgi:acyl carrier protein
MDQALAERLREYIVENFIFEDPGEGLKSSDSFLENGILDSTGVLELVAFLEQTFDIKVEDEELIPENLDSIENAVRYLGEKLSRKACEAQGARA